MSRRFKFKVGEIKYEIPARLLPEDTLLYTYYKDLFSFEKDGEYVILPFDEEYQDTFDAVYDYLVEGIIPDLDFLDNFDYIGMNFLEDYTFINEMEEIFRKELNNPGNRKMPIANSDTFGLIKLTKELWNNLEVPNVTNENYLFHQFEIEKQPWDNIQKDLSALDKYFVNDGKSIVAGGKIFSILFATRVNDVDIFLYDKDSEKAKETIKKIFQKLMFSPILNYKKLPFTTTTQLEIDANSVRMRNDENIFEPVDKQKALEEQKLVNKRREKKYNKIKKDNYIYDTNIIPKENEIPYGIITESIYNTKNFSPATITRTKNTITTTFDNTDVQFILRLYKTMSEILHGFDVDCTSIGYDGKDIWLTQRALYALSHGYNTVNFGRLSPSYEFRLAKYGTRGIAIYVPNFKRENVNQENLDEFYIKNTTSNMSNIYHFLDPVFNVKFTHTLAFDYKSVDFKSLHGLGRLLVLEYIRTINKFSTMNKKSIDKLAEINSDYDNNSSFHRKSTSVMHLFDVFQGAIPDLYEFFDKAADDIVIENVEVLNYLPDQNPNFRHIDGYRINLLRPDDTDLTEYLFDIPYTLYQFFEKLAKVNFPKEAEFKTLSPGEQTTGTFHEIVLKNNDVWYDNMFYHLDLSSFKEQYLDEIII